MKYGSEEGGWFTRIPRESVGIGLWKGICKEAAKLKQDCVFELGEGKRIRFWEDVWCGESPLCAILPTLYSIVGTRGAKVAEVWECSGDSGTRDF